MVERLWVEVNARVNYPIKAVLVQMLENGEFDLTNELDTACVSWFAIQVSAVGIQLFVSSWNEHPKPGDFLQVNNYPSDISPPTSVL